eukprot:TRINITY_DN4584_c0_g1_i1.p2 TRINITY_DN4584_c0_g1~~TRINITY_DN4584_c0_g1_i1.p2  ORF type:complete len:341 (-),score=93.84 TRINITY_DN4584_c0_g1_i1:404-1426(-)
MDDISQSRFTDLNSIIVKECRQRWLEFNTSKQIGEKAKKKIMWKAQTLFRGILLEISSIQERLAGEVLLSSPFEFNIFFIPLLVICGATLVPAVIMLTYLDIQRCLVLDKLRQEQKFLTKYCQKTIESFSDDFIRGVIKSRHIDLSKIVEPMIAVVMKKIDDQLAVLKMPHQETDNQSLNTHIRKIHTLIDDINTFYLDNINEQSIDASLIQIAEGSPIGSGGTSFVYRARYGENEVAVKEVRIDHIVTARELLEEEASWIKFTAKNSQHVVKYFGYYLEEMANQKNQLCDGVGHVRSEASHPKQLFYIRCNCQRCSSANFERNRRHSSGELHPSGHQMC